MKTEQLRKNKYNKIYKFTEKSVHKFKMQKIKLFNLIIQKKNKRKILFNKLSI